METPEAGLAEHLRLIHFTLSAVAGTLLIAALELRAPALREDFNVVIGVVHAVKPSTEMSADTGRGFFERLTRNALGVPAVSAQPGSEGVLRIVRDGLTGQAVHVDFSAPAATVFHSDNADGWSGTDPQGGNGGYTDLYSGTNQGYVPITEGILSRETVEAREKHWHYLGQPMDFWTFSDYATESIRPFIGMWNEAARMRHGYLFDQLGEPEAYLVTTAPADRTIPIRDTGSPLRSAPAMDARCVYLNRLDTRWTPLVPDEAASRTRLSLIAEPEILTEENTWRYVGGEIFSRTIVGAIGRGKFGFSLKRLTDLKPGDLVVAATAVYRHRDLDIQRTLFSLLGERQNNSRLLKEYPEGTFDRTFPHIDDFLQRLDFKGDLDHSLVDSLIKFETDKGGAPVELMGLTIDREALRTWGLGILLLVQLYFWVHFREFSARVVAECGALKMPWVALYPSWGAFALSVFSMVIMPAATAVAVLAVGLGVKSLWTVGFGLGIAVILTSILTIGPLARVRRLIIKTAARREHP